MKKIISLLFILSLALALTACGKEDAHQETGTDPSTAQSAATQTTSPSSTASTAPAFQEIVLVDNDALTFKITGIQDDSILGYTWKVFLENKTDKELMFSLDSVAVNGFMCDPYWAEKVAPAKKSNSTISWLKSDFVENGIQTVEEVDFQLRVYDANDWLAEDVLKETFTVEP